MANNTGAVFNLLTRDGDADTKYLTAVQALNDRLAAIRAAKVLMKQNPIPTLAEVEQTHIMPIKQMFKPFVPIASEYFKTPAKNPMFNNEVKFELPLVGDFISDQVIRIVISGFGTLSNDAPLVRYGVFPGTRLVENVSFSVGKMPIDSYNYIESLFQSNFMLEGHKKLALIRASGQQEDKFATWYNLDAQVSQEYKFTDGAQTLKTYQPRLEMWIPLLFWHNLLPANALSNRMIQWGQRTITVKLAAIQSIISARAAGNTGRIPIPQNILDQIKIENMELYTNCLFTSADIHDVYMKEIGFTMIRTHHRVKQQITNPNGNILLQGLKHATEFIYVGFQPRVNETPEKWTDMVLLQENTFQIPVVQGGNLAVGTAIYKNKIIPIQNLGLTSSGVVIYNSNHYQFYEDFLPFSRGNTAVLMRGAFLIPFNLKTGELQPTGYMNLDRARETYLNWTGGLFSETAPAMLYVCGMSINFLIVKDGKALLLYN